MGGHNGEIAIQGFQDSAIEGGAAWGEVAC